MDNTNFHSSKYWEKRYYEGGNSGSGSYGKSAKFKANFLNKFVEEKSIKSIVEFGCGDGNQLLLAQYLNYTGYDVSQTSVNLCKEIFINDESKKFYHLNDYNNEKFDLSLSLDVVYHLIEQDVYLDHLQKLFNSSKDYVIIYSTNTKFNFLYKKHLFHRMFTNDVANFFPNFTLIETYKSKPIFSTLSFYIYKKS